MDELKKYTNAHKKDFDTYDLDESDQLRLWGNIVSKLPDTSPKVRPLWKKPALRVAAGIALLISCTLLYFTSHMHQNTPHTIVNQELNAIDTHYKLLVNNQVELIKSNPHLSKADQDDFLSLLDDLDAEYNILKAELKLGINNDKIIEAIINNYRKKIQLMEDVLKRSYPPKNDFDDEAIIL